jgi:asparagine synthase (glutamine-hydrolysing)
MHPNQPSPDICLGRPRFDGAGLPADELMRRLREAIASQGLQTACNRLGGDFAIGLHLADGSPVLVVDRFAMQTLAWTQGPDGSVRFAERADDLAGAGAAIDEQAIYDYLYFHAIPSPRTIWRNVQRLPPGHCLHVQRGAARVEPYWRPRFEEPRSASFAALSEQFRELLQAGVARQLDGSKPACFLSGGTDSSTVAGMIGRAAGRPAATFSIGFDASGYDEMAYARIAAKAYGTEHHEYYVTPDDLVDAIPKVAASYDQPFGNSSALPAYYCALMAREHGVSRILAGDGGDELFGGNSRYAKQQVFELYGRVPGLLRRGLLEPVLRQPFAAKLPLFRKAASYVEQASTPMPGRLALYNLVTRLGPANVLAAPLLDRMDLQAPGRHQQAVWDLADAPDILNRELAFDWRYTLGEIDIPKVRGTTRLAGLAVGFPLLDDDLVAFSTRLPQDYKLRGQQLRWFFKEALRGFLPDEIITKTKHGFGLPFGVWATRHDGLKRLATQSLDALVDRNIVRGDFVRDLLSRRLQEHPGYYGEMVWILMMLSQWMDARSPRAAL